jgi:hypothetical protein
MPTSIARPLVEAPPHPLRRLRTAHILALLFSCGALAAGDRDRMALAALPEPPADASPINAQEVLLPTSLGQIRARFDAGGHDRRMVFLIGENHVSAPVQKAVAELLGYLASAYNLRLVCAEGFFGPLPRTGAGLALRANRAAAGALLAARQIRAVEYAALSNPDLRVVGVENMAAYRAHRTKLLAEERRAAQAPEARQWENDLQQFLIGLTLNQEQVRQMKAAGDQARKDCDVDAPLRTLLQLVGPQAPDGLSLAALLKRREMQRAAAAQRFLAQPPDPLLARRNRAMVENTLATAGRSGPLALVVGNLHVAGIEEILRRRAIPFVSILAAGMGDNLIGPSDSSDACVYQMLQDGVQTELEKFFSRMPPPLSSARQSFRDKTAALSALAHADLMLSEGVPAAEVLAQTGLPDGARIIRTFAIAHGHGMEIEHNGARVFFYFGATPEAVAAGVGSRLLEDGSAGGRFFASYGGGGDQQPPIPPAGPPGPADPGDFGRRIQRAVVVRDQTSHEAVAVTFETDGEELVRRVDGRNATPLGITVTVAAAMFQTFKKARSGPDKLYAAQEIARVLLADIDGQLPAKKTRLQLIAAGDFLADQSLPEIAKLARDPGSARFAQLAESYVTPWAQAQRSLDALSRAPSRATVGTMVVWIADDLRASPAGRQALNAIAATGVRVNELPRHGDVLFLLGASSASWAITLKDGGPSVHAADARLKQAVSAAGSVVAFNILLPNDVAAAAKELRAQPLPPPEALGLTAKVAQALEKKTGATPVDRVLREATANEAERARDSLRKQATVATLDRAIAGALEIHTTATITL